MNRAASVKPLNAQAPRGGGGRERGTTTTTATSTTTTTAPKPGAQSRAAPAPARGGGGGGGAGNRTAPKGTAPTAQKRAQTAPQVKPKTTVQTSSIYLPSASGAPTYETMQRIMEKLMNGESAASVIKEAEGRYTGPASSMYAWTLGSWTVNKVGPNHVVMHPQAEANDRKFKELIDAENDRRLLKMSSKGDATMHPEPKGSDIKYVLQFVKEDIFINTDPRLKKGINREAMLSEKGKPLTDTVEQIWKMGSEMGRFGTSDTDEAHLGRPAARPHGTGVLRPPPELLPQFDEFNMLLNQFVDQQMKAPSIGATFPPQTCEKEINESIEKEKKAGKGFDPEAHFKDGKVIIGYNSFKSTAEGYPNYRMPVADLLHYISEDLAKHIIAYCKALAEIIGCSYDSIGSWTIIIIRYRDGGGFKFHIDGIAGFGNYPGFVFNLNMSLQDLVKYFDIINVRNGSKPTTVRYALRQYDTHVMSGESRAFDGHSVPRAHKKMPAGFVMTTLGIKCPEQALKYKHPWVKEMSLSWNTVRFEKKIQYIDAEEWIKAHAVGG